MVGEGTGATNEEYGPSLGLMAIMGKALNDKKILNALVSANQKEEDIFKTVRDKACITLNDCDLRALLKARTKGGKNIIQLLKDARDCMEEDEDPPDPKICC
jgi:hypothetical protein